MKKQLNAETWSDFVQYLKQLDAKEPNNKTTKVKHILSQAYNYFDVESYDRVAIDVIKLFLKSYDYPYLSKLLIRFVNTYNPHGMVADDAYMFIVGIKCEFTYLHTDAEGYSYYATNTSRLIVINEEKMIIVGYNDRY